MFAGACDDCNFVQLKHSFYQNSEREIHSFLANNNRNSITHPHNVVFLCTNFNKTHRSKFRFQAHTMYTSLNLHNNRFNFGVTHCTNNISYFFWFWSYKICNRKNEQNHIGGRRKTLHSYYYMLTKLFPYYSMLMLKFLPRFTCLYIYTKETKCTMYVLDEVLNVQSSV